MDIGLDRQVSVTMIIVFSTLGIFQIKYTIEIIRAHRISLASFSKFYEPSMFVIQVI